MDWGESRVRNHLFAGLVPFFPLSPPPTAPAPCYRLAWSERVYSISLSLSFFLILEAIWVSVSDTDCQHTDTLCSLEVKDPEVPKCLLTNSKVVLGRQRAYPFLLQTLVAFFFVQKPPKPKTKKPKNPQNQILREPKYYKE